MAKEDAKLAYSLVSLYITLYKKKYNKQPIVNRYREKWAMQDVIDTFGFDRSKQLIEYYFECSKPGHPLNWFLYNFDRLNEIMIKSKEDVEHRKTLRNQTRLLVEMELDEH